MAVENQIIIVAIGMLFGYLVETGEKGQGSKFLANMIYLTCGMSLLYYSVVVAIDLYVGASIGLAITLGSIVKAVVDLIPKKKLN